MTQTLTYSNLLLAGCFLLLSAILPVSAQQDTAEDDAKNDAMDAARAQGGDLITLKTGAIMSNVQVLRDTPKGYEVQVLEGMAPIILPRKMVVSIEYDDIDPLHEKRMQAMFGGQDSGFSSGQQLAPELMERLRKPVPGDPIVLNDTDLVQIIAEIANRSNVTIAVHPSVQESIPEPERNWSIATTPDLPLMQILEKQLLVKFPTLAIRYELNKLTLMTKAALAKETPPEEPSTP